MPKLTFDIEARFASFQDGLNRIERQSATTAQRIDRAFTSIRNSVVALGAVATVGVFASFAKEGIAAQAALDDLSESTSVSVELLSQLEVIARRTGADLSQVATGAGRFARSVAEGRAGNKQLVEAFQAIGISVTELREKNVDELFVRYATAIANAEDPTNALAVAVRLAGKSAADSIPFYRDLAAQGLGAVQVTTEQAAAAEKLQNQFRELNVTLTEFRNRIATFVVPALLTLIENFRILREFNLPEIFQLGLSGVGFDNATERLEKLDEQLQKLRETLRRTESRRPSMGNQNVLGLDDTATLQAQIKVLEQRRQLIERTIAAVERSRVRRQGGDEAPRVRVQLPSEAPAAGRAARAPSGPTLEELLARGAMKRQELQDRAEEEADRQAEQERLAIQDLFLRAEETRLRIQEQAQRSAEDEYEAKRLTAEVLRDQLDPTRAYVRELEKVAELEAQFLITQDEAIAAVNRLSAEFKAAQGNIETTNDVARDLGLTFTSAFEDGIAGGSSFRDLLKGIEQDLLRLGTRELVTKPLLGFFQEQLKGVGSGGGGNLIGDLIGKGGGFLRSLLPFANGGVFGGGIVSRPTLFPFASGGSFRTGLMGEAGPEAIMPLRRDSQGRLGVAGGGTSVNVTIMASDVRSFRGSEGQIAAQLGGAVDRAQARNR